MELLHSSRGRHRLARILCDPVEYVEQFLWLKDKRSRLVPFHLNQTQKKILAAKRQAIASGKARKFIVLKARRLGVTSLEQGLSFADAASNKHRTEVTLAHNDKATEIIFRIALRFYENLIGPMKPHRLAQSGKRDLNFDKLDSIFYLGTAGTYGFARGDTASRVHWSEVAWSKGTIDQQRGLLVGMTEAASHGEVILESSPNGVGNLFHEMWKSAYAGENDWTGIFIPWWEDSDNWRDLTRQERDEIQDTITDRERELIERHGLTLEQLAWYRWKSKQPESKGKLMLQEYADDPATCFLVTGQTWFDMEIILQLLNGVPAYDDDTAPDLEVWKEPEPGHQYIAGSDVGEGLPHSDWSTTCILDASTMEQCARLRVRLGPREFARRSAPLCERYNRALWAIERQNHGHSALNTAEHEIHYEKLYYHQDYDIVDSVASTLGFPTTLKTRPQLLDLSKEAVEEGYMKIHDRAYLEETQTFVRNKSGKYEARSDGDCYDDLIMGWGIALHVRDSTPVGPSLAPTQQVGGLGASHFPMGTGSHFPRN